jgi:capsular polysaccharide biosynthesis protein
MLGPPKIIDSPPARDMTSAHEENGRVVEGVFEPPTGPTLAALSRNKLIIFACAVVLAVAGVAYGRSRPSTYTASATLQVGQVNPNSPGFFGYVQSAASLASSFSRSIDAEPVLAAIQHKLKLAPSVAVARLSAEPLPVTPAFRVIATGPTAGAAVDLTNVASKAVIAYESESNNANPEASSLLREYRDASVHLRRAVVHLTHLSRDKHTSADALANAEAERNADLVRIKAISDSYVGAVTSQAPRSGLVSLVAGATSASSDHSAKIQRYGFIGLLVGIVLGGVVAVVRERLRNRRRAAGPSSEVHAGSAPA